MAATLLSGWLADPPGVEHHTCEACWDLFIANEAGVVAGWQAHEGYVRGLAETWGWAPSWRLPDGRLVWFGEYVAIDPLRPRAVQD